MTASGIVRKIDRVGRIVIPSEIRKTLSISSGNSMEIIVNKDQIILSKYADSCLFCGSGKKVRTFQGKKICERCRKKLSMI